MTTPMKPLSVAWMTDYEGIGNAYGYSVHNARAREALCGAGVALDPGAPVAVHVAPAHLFAPAPDKFNVLFMAWETLELPGGHVKGIARADAIVVTARFLLDVVGPLSAGKPVFLCHLGVDTDTYFFRRREKPLDQPFRFLWVGAPNARKGWELVLEAWRPFADDGRVELYLKTTLTNRLERHRNVVFDSRNLPAAGLASLYHSAHAFVFPTFGEGFGLTLAEAMATGLPAIYTPWSSLNEIADVTCAYPVRYRLVPAWATESGGLSTETAPPCDGAVRTHLAQADTADLARQMVAVYRNYAQAARRGARAAARVRRLFTWRLTGRRLAAIIEEVYRRWLPARTCVR